MVTSILLVTSLFVHVYCKLGSILIRECYVVQFECYYCCYSDGSEGSYSRMLVLRFTQLHHIIIGLSWQSLGLAYTKREEGEPVVGRRRETKYHKQILITGNEAVSRYLLSLSLTLHHFTPSFVGV